MLPWETLRRLLGLPADMAPPSALELVQMAIEEPRRARLIGMAIAGQTPKEAPAGVVLGALDRGALDPDTAAELLGCVGHGAGYAAARTILWEDDDGARAAGSAMARILGRRAIADLCLALRRGPSRAAREGAAHGLTEVGDPESAVSIAEAGCDGRIRARVAASCAIRLPADPALWLGYLLHEGVEQRRLATEVVYALLLSDGAESRSRLDALGDEARRAVRRSLDDPNLYMLPDKRETLDAWARLRS